ncbi:MAG: hypothetical protein R3F13_09190 [Prosthecobacter sp.]
MKHTFRFLLAALLACALTSCPETTVDENFGARPAVLDADDWNGSWTHAGDDDDEARFTVLDAALGVVRLEDTDGKDKPSEILLRQPTEAKTPLRFATMREIGEEKAPLPLYLLREGDDGVIFIWGINHEAVAKAIKSGRLKGETKVVKNDPQNHLIADPVNYPVLLEPQFWNWTEPMCLRRVK